MRKIYELTDTQGFAGDFILLTEDDKYPKHWTEVPLPSPIYTPIFNGSRNAKTGEWIGEWTDAGEDTVSLAHCERAWRNAELSRADIELNKVQDGMGIGSVAAWRQYRVDLRNWPENPEFPNSMARPVAPDKV